MKWFDEDICAEGFVATLVDEATPFFARAGTTEYAVCWGEAEPLGFDGLGDTDWTCPAHILADSTTH